VRPAGDGRTGRATARARGGSGEAATRVARATAALHVAVARRFAAAIGFDATRSEMRLFGAGGEVDLLFWHLMHEPTALRTSESYVARLIERLHLLHDCYEQAMDELGLPRSAEASREAAEVFADVAAAGGR
jgi:hypothetical protein